MYNMCIIWVCQWTLVEIFTNNNNKNMKQKKKSLKAHYSSDVPIFFFKLLVVVLHSCCLNHSLIRTISVYPLVNYRQKPRRRYMPKQKANSMCNDKLRQCTAVQQATHWTIKNQRWPKANGEKIERSKLLKLKFQ